MALVPADSFDIYSSGSFMITHTTVISQVFRLPGLRQRPRSGEGGGGGVEGGGGEVIGDGKGGGAVGRGGEDGGGEGWR